MERFFGKIEGDRALLDSEKSHHLLHVLRAKIGDYIEVVDTGELYLCKIENVNPLNIKVEKSLYSPSELPIDVVLAFALLKGGHDELVLQKGTELGVKEFIPYISKRTIIKLDEKDKKRRLERFEKIVGGASMQSKRLIIPTIHEILSFDGVINYKADHVFFAYEGLSHKSFNLLDEAKKIKKGEKILLIVGPEGGFDEKEVEKSSQKGLTAVSLGQRILRAETASLYLASVLSFLGEGLK